VIVLERTKLFAKEQHQRDRHYGDECENPENIIS
jgi:hypothetical protein